jgi:hypothetical protein
MARQNIGVGASANDGTGDTLRDTGTKINANFVELYQKLGGDSSSLSGQISVTNSGLQFEGSAADDFETALVVENPTADRTATLPNATGIIILDTATQTLTNKTLTTPLLTTPKINDLSSDHTYNVVAGELVANRNIALPVLASDDTFVFATVAQTLTNKTLTSSTLTEPRIQIAINDANGAEIFGITPVASAVNHIDVSNAATGSNPVIAADGTDTDFNIDIKGKGTGSVSIDKVAYGSNTQTAAGAADPTSTYIVVNSGSTIAISVADGTTIGEYKIFTNKGAGAATVTPNNFAQGTSVALDQHDTSTLIWDGTNWNLLAQHGATIA